MKFASGLASGQRTAPELAAQAVREALATAGLQRASNVLLFLTRDLARQAQPAVLAAARAAGCLQVFGSTASGLFTERQLLLDQPGAAALVMNEQDGTLPDQGCMLSLSGHSALPFAWQGDTARAGLLDTDALTWAQARVSDNACAEYRLPRLKVHQALSTGLRPLSAALAVEICAAYELRQIAGQPALAALRRCLPAELREHPPWHQIALLRHADEPGIAILSANADGSLTLAEALEPGEKIVWAIRQPLACEQDMHQSLIAASQQMPRPAFGLMFSCIGRGPLFYGGEDLDQHAFRSRFPGVPLLGAYGSGQIASNAGKNRLFHNSVVTLLFEGSHV